MKKKLSFILPSNKDGGGNRWSFLLSSQLSKLSGKYDVEFIMPVYSNYKNIYKVDKKVKLKLYKVKNNFKIFSIFGFIFFLKKNISHDSIIIVSDPILSIFMIFFKNIVIRNVASDDYNLFNYSEYKYFGLVFLYKLLTFLSFFYSNVNFVFNSVYTYRKIINKMKFPIKYLNIKPEIIHPIIENKYLELPVKNITKEKAIVIFPRKHNFKGFKLIVELNERNVFKILGIDKIYLIYNKSEHLKEFEHPNFTCINPSNDEEIINILDKCICFISTSTSEGFGLPPLEAMARGCPPIVVDAGGTSTFCFNFYNSLLCKPNDANSIKNNLELIFKNDKIRQKLINNSLELPLKFSESNGCKKWDNYISNVIINNSKSNVKKDDKKFTTYLKFNIGKFYHIYKTMDMKLKTTILFEIIFFPILILINIFKNYICYFIPNNNKKIIREDNSQSIALCIQDWINYNSLRFKDLKNGGRYYCGIEKQYNKFESKKYSIDKYLYISRDSDNLTKDYFNFTKNGFSIIYNSNDYLDFSSYSNFYNDNKNKDILIFMNSSVSTEFNEPIIDSYIDYFLANKDVGLFGISANSKKYQSIVPFGFEPHIQSIFFITTSKILNKVIKINNGFFPGTDKTKHNKYRLIIDGEIKLNEIILKLGYSIAYVSDYGEVIKYKKDKIINNKFLWSKPYGDVRLITNYPAQAKIINNFY